MRSRMAFLCGIVFALTIPYAPAGTYSGGSGTPEDPYQIGTPDDILEMSATSADWSGHFLMIADVNMLGHTFNQAPISPNPAEDCNFRGTRFTGVFRGNGHRILNLSIRAGYHVGLFGLIGSGGRILNLGVEAVEIQGSEYVGALAGKNEGSITACYSTGSVTGGSRVGGLVGSNDKGVITACCTNGSVTGDFTLGGLVGENEGSIVASYSTGAVTGAAGIGGFVGENWAPITACYSTGAVAASDLFWGGFVGIDLSDAITACFWDKQTAGAWGSVGGTPRTTAQMQQAATFLDAGWDAWDEMGNGTCDYWHLEDGRYPQLLWQVGPIPTPEGQGTPDDPYLIRNASDLGRIWFRPTAHCRLTESLDLSGVSWLVSPVPVFAGYFDGAGHAISYLQITAGGSLGLFGRIEATGTISDLGLEDVDVQASGDYVGTLAGWNQGSITTCYSTGTVTGHESTGGLVGYNQGSITASHSAARVLGDWCRTGGLVGSNQGSITVCYSTGRIGEQRPGAHIYVGGLVGSNSGSITACYATGAVTGGSDVGGLVGWHVAGSVTNCYSTAAVTGRDTIGGLVGRNGSEWWTGGSITTSHSTGVITGSSNVGGLVGDNYGSTTLCFWDKWTSGQSSSAGGTPLTTAQMQQAATFLDAGWDFVGEGENGSEDTWRMCADGVEYPRLAWELAQDGDFDCPDGVGIEDVWYLSGRWLATTPATVGAADPTGDGVADLADLAILAAHWLAGP